MRVPALLLATLIASPALAEVPTFDASYRVQVRGINAGTARIWVEAEEDGYAMRSVVRPGRMARMFGADRVVELSRLELHAGALRSTFYEQQQGDDRERVAFDSTGGASGRYRGQDYQLDVPHNVQDRLGLQLVLMHDLGRDRLRSRYQVVARGRLREMRFERVGEEIVRVPAGEFRTVVYERSEDRPDRSSRLWLSPEHDYLAVRIEDYRDGDLRTRLELTAVD